MGKKMMAVLLALALLSGCAAREEAVSQTETTVPTESTEAQTEPVPMEIAAEENREGELVFSITMEDFIDGYNSIFPAENDAQYLTPAGDWRCSTYDSAPHSDYETLRYLFSEDERVYSLPTVEVYTPTDSGQIQMVSVNFDEHSRTEDMYELYEQMCTTVLQTFFPELGLSEARALCQTLNQLAYDNMVELEEVGSGERVPCTVYYRDGVGVYPYFEVGSWVRMCVIPVTQHTLDEFAAMGTQVCALES